MGVTAGLLNLSLGVVYVGIGTMVAIDLEKAIRRRGWSHFGVAWLTVMYTCGAHHLVHGLHLSAEGRGIGWLDLLAVGIGLPAGTVWSLLRIEAVRGGRGDRYIAGTPGWLRLVAAGYVLVGVLVIGMLVRLGMDGMHTEPRLVPNVLLFGLYIGIGAALFRGQRRNRRELGGWSTSGLALMMIFPTCGVMHAVYVIYAGGGAFAPDFHGLWVDWLGVPAALYFLWVIRGLESGTVTDWNNRYEAIEDLATGTPAVDPAASSRSVPEVVG